jgi:hypothetical protein
MYFFKLFSIIFVLALSACGSGDDLTPPTAEGLWRGIVTDTVVVVDANNKVINEYKEEFDATGFVLPDGSYYFKYGEASDLSIFFGKSSMTDATIQSGQVFNRYRKQTRQGTFTGDVTTNSQLSMVFSPNNDDSFGLGIGVFSFLSDYNKASSFSNLAGTYENGGGITSKIVIDDKGGFTGTLVGGTVSDGKITILNPEKNLYKFDFTWKSANDPAKFSGAAAFVDGKLLLISPNEHVGSNEAKAHWITTELTKIP